MNKKSVLLYKILVIGTLILLIGISVIPSAGHEINNINAFHSSLETVDSPNGLLSCNHLAYVGGFICGLLEFKLNDPSNLTCACEDAGVLDFATWTNDGFIMTHEYTTGILYKIDPETCEMWAIGGGGMSCNGLTWDPVNNVIYTTTGNMLLVYDPDTGEQEVIGSHGQPDIYMYGLACDAYGILYGWDLVTDKLWTIDTETGQASLVGPLGVEIWYSDGDFCKKDDILYLVSYNDDPPSSVLYECDEDTGSCTLVGQFKYAVYEKFFVIPWNYPPGVPIYLSPLNNSQDVPIDTTLTWSCIDPDGDTLIFDVYFGICNPPPKVESNQSSKSYDPGILDFNTTYYWKIVVWDECGESTSGPIWCFTTEQGCILPPDTPKIEGKRRFKQGEGGNYPYTINSTDPNGDDVCFVINWSDGTQEVTDYYASGEQITINASIPSKGGTYILFEIKAKDVYGLESNWTKLEVTVPRNKTTINSFYQLFFERFPLLERLLSLLGLI